MRSRPCWLVRSVAFSSSGSWVWCAHDGAGRARGVARPVARRPGTTPAAVAQRRGGGSARRGHRRCGVAGRGGGCGRAGRAARGADCVLAGHTGGSGGNERVPRGVGIRVRAGGALGPDRPLDRGRRCGGSRVRRGGTCARSWPGVRTAARGRHVCRCHAGHPHAGRPRAGLVLGSRPGRDGSSGGGGRPRSGRSGRRSRAGHRHRGRHAASLRHALRQRRAGQRGALGQPARCDGPRCLSGTVRADLGRGAVHRRGRRGPSA